MGDRLKSTSLDDLPLHLILEILTSSRLSGVDLLSLELTSRLFRGSNFCFPLKFGSLVDFAAFQLCQSHNLYTSMRLNMQEEVLNRCNGNWKRLLRFLQSSDMVDTSSDNHLQVKSGRYHTLLIKNSSVYSCGSCICGVLGHGPEVTQCVAFTRINFPFPAQVVHVSASYNHAAFVTQCGEVFTCGDNSSMCCGHTDTNRAIFGPRRVEALRGFSIKQVAAGLSFTAFLSTEGHVYSCGTNAHGQLGHGDNVDSATPKIIEQLACLGFIVQISAGPSYVLAVANDGTLYSFGNGADFCLGHGEQHDEQQPRAVESFRRKGIHVTRVCAGGTHAVALDSSGYVYTWGKGYCGALGHGDETDKTSPEIVRSLESHLAVQVCASRRKTFVLTEGGSIYGFGWMAFGSLGFLNRGPSDKVLYPEVVRKFEATSYISSKHRFIPYFSGH
ncbi:guanyl-nucleotide exchange factor [Lithospermum erythrorhizon]|uniref:Guanyl-nucleotide exchange factor n=1 Tax=Lithospermum erythrorhizon TaxID=34254 RepID=A0AAV3QYA5_LITER